MKTIEINRKYYSVPENWNELNRQQLLQVMDLLYVQTYSIEKALLKFVKILAGLSWWAFFRAPLTTVERYRFSIWRIRSSWAEYLFMSKVECTGLEEYMYLSEFLLTSNLLTKQVLKQYKGFYGPADGLSNLKMGEFIFSEHYYMKWAESREETDLDQLVAVLHRPAKRGYNFKKNAEGDPRVPFNENLCEYHSKKIGKWPLAVKMAVVTHYEACRQQWIEANPDVFGGGVESAKYGLLSIMRGVAKSGVHGDFDKVQYKEVPMILIELNELVHEAKEYEKAMKK